MPALPSPPLTPDNQPERILIVRLSAHGDVMQTLPLLGLIKHHSPETHVGWLVEESAAPLLTNHPYIDTLHVCKRKHWLKQLKSGQIFDALREIKAFTSQLKAENYTHSVDVQGLLKSAIWSWLASIPNRWGYKATREWADTFYNHIIPPHNMADTDTATIDWFTRFCQPLFGVDTSPYVNGDKPWPFPLKTIDGNDQQQASKWISQLSKPEQTNVPTIIMAPGTIWPSKTWPSAYWKEVLQTVNHWGWPCILVGSPAEKALCDELTAGLSKSDLTLNLAGETSWPQLIALMHHADLMIGLDSAPLHVAQAVSGNNNGKPAIIGVFGPTAPKRTGAIGHQHQAITTNHNLPCQPCFNRRCHLSPPEQLACMTLLSPEAVLTGLRKQAVSLGYTVPEQNAGAIA